MTKIDTVTQFHFPGEAGGLPSTLEPGRFENFQIFPAPFPAMEEGKHINQKQIPYPLMRGARVCMNYGFFHFRGEGRRAVSRLLIYNLMREEVCPSGIFRGPLIIRGFFSIEIGGGAC